MLRAFRTALSHSEKFLQRLKMLMATFGEDAASVTKTSCWYFQICLSIFLIKNTIFGGGLFRNRCTWDWNRFNHYLEKTHGKEISLDILPLCRYQNGWERDVFANCLLSYNQHRLPTWTVFLQRSLNCLLNCSWFQNLTIGIKFVQLPFWCQLIPIQKKQQKEIDSLRGFWLWFFDCLQEALTKMILVDSLQKRLGWSQTWICW